MYSASELGFKEVQHSTGEKVPYSSDTVFPYFVQDYPYSFENDVQKAMRERFPDKNRDELYLTYNDAELPVVFIISEKRLG